MTENPARWIVFASFFTGNDTWIDDFCPRRDIVFTKIIPDGKSKSWHFRGATTPFSDWISYFSYVRKGLKTNPEGVIACFPQLAFVAAFLLMVLGRSDIPLIAWNFNLGSLSNPLKRVIAAFVLRRVNRFVVHSRDEIRKYASWLWMSEERFSFVPLQCGKMDEVRGGAFKTPYILSMGSANRDYDTLLAAVRDLNLPTVIIAKKGAVEKMPDLPCLTKLHSLSMQECLSILKNAAISVTTLMDSEVASGQVTFVTSMMMGIPTVATRCTGTVDYIVDGETGFLVPPYDVSVLKDVILKLWNDEGLRRGIAARGKMYAEEHFSDPVAGQHLSRIIDLTLTPPIFT